MRLAKISAPRENSAPCERKFVCNKQFCLIKNTANKQRISHRKITANKQRISNHRRISTWGEFTYYILGPLHRHQWRKEEVDVMF